MKPWILLGLLAAAPAAAQQGCGVTSPAPGFAAGQAQLADHLAPGASAELALKPAADLRFAPPPTRPITPGTFGGIFPLEIRSAGTYRIALSQPVWIDVVRAGAPVASSEHHHGEACSGIAKTVGFDLEPGLYSVQLSEGTRRAVTAKVTRATVLPVGK